MAIKWFYFAMALLGGMAPVATLYLLNLHRAVPGLLVDLGLLIFVLGLSFLFIPIGIAAGLALAVVLHLAWGWLASRRRAAAGAASSRRT